MKKTSGIRNGLVMMLGLAFAMSATAEAVVTETVAVETPTAGAPPETVVVESATVEAPAPDGVKSEPVKTGTMVLPLRFAATVPIGESRDDGSCLVNQEAGIQLIGSPWAPYFYGMGLSPLFTDFSVQNFYGLFVGWQSQIENTYGVTFALVNINGEFNLDYYLGTGNCYGLQAALVNISDTAYMQFGAVGNLAGSAPGVQAAGLLNKTDTMYGLQMALINGIFDAQDSCGAQFGLINGVMGDSDESDLVQFGLCNQTLAAGPLQIGVFNAADDDLDFQFGLVNESAGAGLQIGLLNFSEDGWLPFCPFVLYAAPQDEPEASEAAEMSDDSVI